MIQSQNANRSATQTLRTVEVYLCRDVIFLSLLEHSGGVEFSVVEDTVDGNFQELAENITAN